MKKITNELTFPTLDNVNVTFSIGGLYKVLPPYRAMNYDTDDLNRLDFLVIMPVGLHRVGNYITCVVIYTEQQNHTRVKDINESDMVIEADDMPGIHIDNNALYDMFSLFNNTSSIDFHKDGIYIRTSIFTIQFDKEHLASMKFIPLKENKYDMRTWPKSAINSWAEYHLSLPQDQTVILHDINERWKYIEMAQEMFTHQCAEFNKVAKKKVDAHRKKVADIRKTMQYAFVGNVTSDYRYCKTDTRRALGDYILNIDKQDSDEFINSHEPTAILTRFTDVRLINKHYNIVIQKLYTEKDNTWLVECVINEVAYNTYISDQLPILYTSDMCIISLNDKYFIHIMNKNVDVATGLNRSNNVVTKYNMADAHRQAAKAAYRPPAMIPPQELRRKPEVVVNEGIMAFRTHAGVRTHAGDELIDAPIYGNKLPDNAPYDYKTFMADYVKKQPDEPIMVAPEREVVEAAFPEVADDIPEINEEDEDEFF